MARALLEALGQREVLLTVDDTHHLNPAAADYLVALLGAPGLTLYLAGRDLGNIRALPRLVASGLATVLGPEDLLALTGYLPVHLEEEVEHRLDAMRPGEYQALLSLAGLPLWREEDLQRAGLSFHQLVAVHGLPIGRRKGVYWPQEVLREALIRRAGAEVLIRNAARLEGSHPGLAARLYVRAGAPQEVLRLAEPRTEGWIAYSRWDEVLEWLGPVPEEHLGPLAGLVALARLEKGNVEGALALAHAYPTDPLALLTLALHAYRAGRAAEAQALAERALAGENRGVVELLARRIALAARMAQGVPGASLLEEAKALLRKAEVWPSQYLAVLSQYLALSPRPTPALAQEGFRKCMELGLPQRAAPFLMSWVEAALVGQAEPEEVLEGARKLQEYGRLGVPLALVCGHLAEGSLLAYKGEWEGAEAAFQRARLHASEGDFWDMWYSATQSLVEVHLAQGNLREVGALLDEMDLVVEARDLVPTHRVYRALWLLRQGEVHRAHRLLEEAKDDPGEAGAIARALLGVALTPREETPWFSLSKRLLGLPTTSRVVSATEQALYAHGLKLRLSFSELTYLLALMLAPGTPGEIAERVYGDPGKAQAVHTAMSRLRSKGVPGLATQGRRYVLEGYRLDLALRIEASRQLPHLLEGLDLGTLPSEPPVWEVWQERLRTMAKAVVLEWARRGVRISGAHLLDPEDPEYLEALGYPEALHALAQGERWA
ncbi:hypothetical protein [Thermus caldifontis]|uniref:hypothetical protein n=1 Tax=Thermus caldifontis TaxID=1930763 RepID=UPI0013B407DD|nr:hypothetical protein [Thermus caldifontis]